VQQQLNADSVVFNHVKSRNSTQLELAIDDQHRSSTIHNVITHTRQIETDCRFIIQLSQTDYGLCKKFDIYIPNKGHLTYISNFCFFLYCLLLHLPC